MDCQTNRLLNIKIIDSSYKISQNAFKNKFRPNFQFVKIFYIIGFLSIYYSPIIRLSSIIYRSVEEVIHKH
jgi:hypothetical protein